MKEVLLFKVIYVPLAFASRFEREGVQGALFDFFEMHQAETFVESGKFFKASTDGTRRFARNMLYEKSSFLCIFFGGKYRGFPMKTSAGEQQLDENYVRRVQE